MANDELISVIMSTYNDGEYLKDALNSILWQTYSNIEVILINDCSTDDTDEIIRNIQDERLRYYVNSERCGLTKNLNKALSMAKGKYIARMDADDISFPTRFEKQVEFLKQHESVALVGTGIQEFGSSHGQWIQNENPEWIKVHLLVNSALPHPSFMFNRIIYDEGIMYDENYSKAQDYDFLFRVSRKYKISCVNEVLLFYRRHSKQISTAGVDSQADIAKSIRFNNLKSLNIVFSREEEGIFDSICKGPIDTQREYTISELWESEELIDKVYVKLYDSGYDRQQLYILFSELFSAQFLRCNKEELEKYIRKMKFWKKLHKELRGFKFLKGEYRDEFFEFQDK